MAGRIPIFFIIVVSSGIRIVSAGHKAYASEKAKGTTKKMNKRLPILVSIADPEADLYN